MKFRMCRSIGTGMPIDKFMGLYGWNENSKVECFLSSVIPPDVELKDYWKFAYRKYSNVSYYGCIHSMTPYKFEEHNVDHSDSELLLIETEEEFEADSVEEAKKIFKERVQSNIDVIFADPLYHVDLTVEDLLRAGEISSKL